MSFTPDTPIYFKQWKCRLKTSRYIENLDKIALVLVDYEDGQMITVASVNLVDFPVLPPEVAIKTWSENEGVVKCLQQAGVIGPIKYELPAGHGIACVCDVLIDVPEVEMK
jgi:hypothetical protein